MKFPVRRTIVAAAAVALASLTLAGCAGAAASSDGASTPSSGDNSITVYAPWGDAQRTDFITQHAKKEIGVNVKFVVGGGGDLAARLVSEKNNSQADVVVGLGESLMNQVSAEGLFQQSTPAWMGLIPSEFQTGADFTLFTQTPIVIAYNASKLSAAEAPKTWEELADPKWKNKFVFPSLTGQTGQAAAVGILWRYADHKTGEVSQKGWDTLGAILKNSKQLSDGQTYDWNWVKSGELPIVVNWLGGIQTGASDNGLDLKVIDTQGGTPFVSTGVGLIKATSHAETAKKFIDWFGSADTQVAFVKATNNDTPLNTDALKQLPEAKAAIEQVHKQDIDWAVVTPHLTDWLQKIQLELVG